MYEARQNKERVSRRIDSADGGMKRRKNIDYKKNNIIQSKSEKYNTPLQKSILQFEKKNKNDALRYLMHSNDPIHRQIILKYLYGTLSLIRITGTEGSEKALFIDDIQLKKMKYKGWMNDEELWFRGMTKEQYNGLINTNMLRFNKNDYGGITQNKEYTDDYNDFGIAFLVPKENSKGLESNLKEKANVLSKGESGGVMSIGLGPKGSRANGNPTISASDYFNQRLFSGIIKWALIRCKIDIK